jgi:hypothetical protein
MLCQFKPVGQVGVAKDTNKSNFIGNANPSIEHVKNIN